MSETQKREARYLGVEAPDTKAVVDFYGKYGVVVKLTLEKNQLRVEVTACDDRCTILEDKCYEVPEADDLH